MQGKHYFAKIVNEQQQLCVNSESNPNIPNLGQGVRTQCMLPYLMYNTAMYNIPQNNSISRHVDKMLSKLGNLD